MADRSKIEWTDATWNPIRARNRETGGIGHFCEHVSEGCRFCYAERMQPRFGNPIRYAAQDRLKVEVFLDEKTLLAPLRWRKPRMVFVCSMTDLFGEWVTDEWIDRVFAVMDICPQHIFQVLTKRPQRARDYLLPARARPLPNVWLGTSIENQPTADERIPHLLDTPAAIRFVSFEPALGPLDPRQWLFDYGCGCGWGGQPLDYCENCGWRGHAPGEVGESPCPGCGEYLSNYNACPECDGHDGDGMSFGPNHAWLDWIIVGGESGPNARPMHPDWARAVRDRCAEAGVAFFFKQWGAYKDGSDFKPGAIVVMNDGRTCEFGRATLVDMDRDKPVAPTNPTLMRNVGKAAAGATLDGREHREFPERRIRGRS